MTTLTQLLKSRTAGNGRQFWTINGGEIAQLTASYFEVKAATDRALRVTNFGGLKPRASARALPADKG